MNENALAKAVCEQEGGVVNLTIAQVKEVIKKTLDILAQQPMSKVCALVEKHKQE